MHAYRLRKGTGKFCDQACYLAHRWRKSGKCTKCGKSCANRFCSDACRRTYWDANGYAVYGRRNKNWERKHALIKELGGCCETCGNNDHRVLDIDHKNPAGKIKPKNGHYAWSRRFKDWDANKGNLRLLCANCHRLHTWEQRGFGPTGLRIVSE